MSIEHIRYDAMIGLVKVVSLPLIILLKYLIFISRIDVANWRIAQLSCKFLMQGLEEISEELLGVLLIVVIELAFP